MQVPLKGRDWHTSIANILFCTKSRHVLSSFFLLSPFSHALCSIRSAGCCSLHPSQSGEKYHYCYCVLIQSGRVGMSLSLIWMFGTREKKNQEQEYRQKCRCFDLFLLYLLQRTYLLPTTTVQLAHPFPTFAMLKSTTSPFLFQGAFGTHPAH